jgi:hypothetical protein
MAMMRRGPLEQYSAEWVLRQASSTAATGSVEFHTSEPLTLYLRGGRICHGVDGVPVTGFVTGTDGEHADEAAARAQASRLVARALHATDGWYYFDPLGHHDDAGPWQWEAASLIRDARVQLQPPSPPEPAPAPAPAAVVAPVAPDTAAPAAPARSDRPDRSERSDRPVRLAAPADGGSVTLSAESWRIVCALAAPRPATELRQSLGWSPARLDAALTELVTSGVLGDPTPASRPSAAPPEPPAAVTAPAAARPVTPPARPPAPAARPVPPTVPPAPGARAAVSVDRRSALRRLISNLKPA